MPIAQTGSYAIATAIFACAMTSEEGVDLLLHDAQGLARPALLQRLTHANDREEARGRWACLLRHECVASAKYWRAAE